jgi:phage shock protein A
MALITRFTRLFQADLHAVMDRIEEPDILLKQAVREMEEDIARDEQRSKVVQHELAHIGQRGSELDQSLRQIDEEMDLCFDSGKDELARGLIKRKLEAQQLHLALSRKEQSMHDTLDQIAARLKENHLRLTAMRQKAELLAEDDVGSSGDQPWSVSPVTIRDEDVEVAFLREKKRRNLS